MASGFNNFAGKLYHDTLQGLEDKSINATYDMEPAREIIATRARSLYMASSIAHTCIERLVSGIVGSGFICSDKEIQSKLNSTEFDITETWTLNDLIEQCVRNWLIDGDAFLLEIDGKYKVIEPNRVSTPITFSMNEDGIKYNPETKNLVIGGIEVNYFGAPVGYHIRRNKRYPVWDYVDKANVIHLFDCERPEQFRGISRLSRIIEQIYSVHCYEKSEVQAALLESCFSAFITTDKANNDVFLSEPVEDVETGEIHEDITPAGAGRIYKLNNGEKLEVVAPKRPYNGFGVFIDTVLRMFAQDLGIPYQILSLNVDGTYSSAKAAALEAQKLYRKYQTFIAKRLLNKVLKCNDNIQWSVSQPRSFDPVAEHDFYLMAYKEGFVSAEEVSNVLFGHDVYDIDKLKSQAGELQTISNPEEEELV